ncbi:MAG TPA: glycosyltransferase family 9 protein [Bordetella sp.]|nr:glycosyltransferase family 9 protein [Bordetella sp.]
MTDAQVAWAGARRILCVRLDNLGDVLMTTPAMRALKALQGRPQLALLASSSGASAASFLPDVDEVLRYDAAWVKNDATGNRADLQMIERLRAGQFDAAVVFTVYSQSALPAALLCHLAGIPRVLAHSRENPYRLLTDWVREREPEQGVRHEVQRQLDLVASVGATAADTALAWRVRQCDRAALHQRLDAAGITERDGWIAVHGGASAASRRYPAAQYAQVIAAMRGEGRRILLLGTASERGLGGALDAQRQMAPGLVDLCGELTLGELAAAIEGAAVLVCNNSGPAHMAAALGVPVVDLYALTNPQHTPWQVPNRVLYHDVPCKYCYRSVCPQGHHACLVKVAPARVAAAARELLAQQRPDMPAGAAA